MRIGTSRPGELVTEDDLRELSRFKSIYFGAIGDERVKPGVLEKGILLALRFHFDQYVNLRPIKLLAGVPTPLANKGPAEIDFVVVRENTEDFYVGIGGRQGPGRSHADLEVLRSLYSVKFGLDIESDAEELAYQIGVVTREGSRRVMEYAFALAERRKRKVASVDKANVLSDVYGLWREVFGEVAAAHPSVATEYTFVDAITMWFVKNPEWFDVVVTPNMFGDIITDLGAMIQGGLGLAPGGNINPDGTSMFEPIHGSAPKYRGQERREPDRDRLGRSAAPRLARRARGRGRRGAGDRADDRRRRRDARHGRRVLDLGRGRSPGAARGETGLSLSCPRWSAGSRSTSTTCRPRPRS